MAFIQTDSDTMSGSAGVSVDITNPVHAAYCGATVIGGTAVVGSVVVTGMVAPGIVVVPGAVAAGLCAYAGWENDRRANKLDVKTDAKPASTDAPQTETAAA